MIPRPLQKKLLLLLLALWIVILAAMHLVGPRESKVAAAPARKSPPPKVAVAKSRGELQLSPWNRTSEPLEEGAYNPFRPLAGYLEPPPEKVAKAKAPPPPPPDPYIEELKTFKYFGYAQDEKKRVAFLGKGTTSYTVKEKDIIEDKFLVKKITDEYVVIGEPRGSKELTITQAGFGEAPRGAGPIPSSAVVPPAPSPYPAITTSPPTSPTPPGPRLPPERRGLRERRSPGTTRPSLPKEGGETP